MFYRCTVKILHTLIACTLCLSRGHRAVWGRTTIQHIKNCTSRQQLFSSCQEGYAVVSIWTSVPICCYPVRSAPSELMTFAQFWSHLAVFACVMKSPKRSHGHIQRKKVEQLNGDHCSSLVFTVADPHCNHATALSDPSHLNAGSGPLHEEATVSLAVSVLYTVRLVTSNPHGHQSQDLL